MRICYFGDYNADYARTRVLITGLLASGVTIVHCNVHTQGIKKYWELWKKHRSLVGKYDVIFIPVSLSRTLSFVAKLYSTKPVIWEPLFSLYDNWVYDRKLAAPRSPKAWYYWFLDWFGCTFSDLIILDTNTNAAYFSETFHIPKTKFARMLVGANTDIFFPHDRTQASTQFEIEFHGNYIPVQGTDVIVRAAKLLEKDAVHFTMIGSGQEKKNTEKLALDLGVTNISFLHFLHGRELVQYIANADVCIGLVGNVPRVVRAIPNKLYEAAAMARPTINADTVALREVFTPGVDTVGMKQGDPESLAHAIRELKISHCAEEIGRHAYQTFLDSATPEKVAKNFLITLQERFFVH